MKRIIQQKPILIALVVVLMDDLTVNDLFDLNTITRLMELSQSYIKNIGCSIFLILNDIACNEIPRRLFSANILSISLLSIPSITIGRY